MMRRRRRGLVPVVVAIALLAATAGAALTASSPIAALSVSGSPFSPNGDGVRDTVVLRLQLAEPATVTVRVIDFGAHTVAVLASSRALGTGIRTFSWNGRDRQRRTVADGAYRFRVTAASGGRTWTATSGWITKSALVAYRPNPGAVTVVIGPGHGGPDPGAVAYDGTYEKTYNLDVSRRLAAMLRGAGVAVVMTRSTDTAVNPRRLDLTGDGRWTSQDESQARNDRANAAGADLYLVLHNDAYRDSRAHGTTTFCRSDRPWGDLSCLLARYVQAESLAALGRFRSSTWAPFDRGVRWHDFYALSPYARPYPVRSTLMPAALAEALFVTNPGDLASLRNPAVRQALAAAYYRAVCRWLAARAWGARYEVLEGPTSLVAGSSGLFWVEVTNRGIKALPAGTALVAGMQVAVPLFDGRGERAPADLVAGSVALTAPLAPGASTILEVPVTAPGSAGSWIAEFGLVLPNGARLDRRGVVRAQSRLTVDLAVEATPSP